MDRRNLEKDVEERLSTIESQKPDSSVVWPEGCYGAARAWLLFIGPSPGGEAPSRPSEERDPEGGEPVWNVVYDEPDTWKGGFRVSMRPLVERIVGLPFERSGKMYAFANLDWNPQSDFKPRMRSGLPDVMKVLRVCQARIAVVMTEDATNILIPHLEDHIGLDLEHRREDISIPALRGMHTSLDTWEVKRSPDESISLWFIARLPRHPTKITRVEDAKMIGDAIRLAFEKGV